jgi:hypothetical protein
MLYLPSSVSEIAKDSSKWALIRQGINPTESPRLLGNFAATTTKQRAKKLQSSKKNLLVDNLVKAESTITAVKSLPNRLKYDYERRVIARELSKDQDVSYRIQKQLPSGSMKEKKQKAQKASEGKSFFVLRLPEAEAAVAMQTETITDTPIHEVETIDSSVSSSAFAISPLSAQLASLAEEFTWLGREIIAVDMLRQVDTLKQLQSSEELDDSLTQQAQETRSQLELMKDKMKALAAAAGICQEVITRDKSNMDLIAYFASSEVSQLQRANMLGALSVVSEYCNQLRSRVAMNQELYKLIADSIIVLEDLSVSTNADAAIEFQSSTQAISSESMTVESAVETTAESFETDEKKVLNILLTSLDMSLFLLETTMKSIGSILVDRGGQVYERVMQTYCIDETIALTSERLESGLAIVLYGGKRSSKNVGSWRLLGQMKGASLSAKAL